MLPMGVLSGLLLYESPREEAGEESESEKNNLPFPVMHFFHITFSSFVPY